MLDRLPESFTCQFSLLPLPDFPGLSLLRLDVPMAFGRLYCSGSLLLPSGGLALARSGVK